MNTEPPAGDDLQKLLVAAKQDVLRRAAETPQATPRRASWPRRHIGITFGLVAVLALGGTTAALAAILPAPFHAAAPSASATPTPVAPTPTPTASASPSPTEQPVADTTPTPAVDFGCDALDSAVTIPGGAGAVVPEPESATEFDAEDASLLQSGVLSCAWKPSGSPSDYWGVTVHIAPAGTVGRAAIARMNADGEAPFGLGDASALSCEDSPESAGCSTSTVVGPWWFETALGSFDVPRGATTIPDAQRSLVQAIITRLTGLEPAPAWTAPATSWSAQMSCDDLRGADVAGAIGDPTLLAPQDPLAGGSYPPFHDAEIHVVHCVWTHSDATGQPVQNTDMGDIGVDIAPSAGWAVGTETPPGTPVTVTGASTALWQCAPLGFDIGEQTPICFLDMVSDGSWVRVTSQATVDTPAHRQLLIRAAEAILAAHHAG